MVPPLLINFEFLSLQLMHIGHKGLPATELLNSLVSPFLLLQQFDDPCFDLCLLLLNLLLVDDGLHHVSLGHASESGDACR